MSTVYCFNHEENDGYGKCDILVQHWNNENFRTVLIDKDRFERLDAWEMTRLLNNAYETGKRECKEEFRDFLGIK